MSGARDLRLRIMFAGIDRLSGVLGGIGAASRRAGAAVHETNRELGSQRRELQAVQRQLAQGSGNVTELVNRERALADAIERGTRELDQRREAFDRLRGAQERFDRTQAMGDKLQAGGMKAVGAGVAMGAGLGVSVNSAMNMEESMAGVAKVTNMDNSAIAQMSTDFLDLSTRIPMAAAELGNIAAAAGAAGIGMDKNGKAMKDQRQQLLTFTEDASKMGVAFDMSADEAGSTMAKWRTSFGMGQDGVRALGDQVNALTNRFGGKADAVSDILTRIGPLGKVAGLAAPQIAALGSTLNSIGVENEVAATGIKNMMLALTSGSKATKSQSSAFKALGLDATEVSRRMQTDAAGTITDVMERIGKLDKAAQPGMLKELFGSESLGAIAPLLTNLDGLKQRLGLVGDAAAYTGSMQGEFLSRIATTKGAVGLAANSLQAINIEMGQKLLPYVVSAANGVRSAAAAFRSWAHENPALAGGIVKIAALIATLLVSFGGLAIAGGTLMKTWAVIRLGATMTMGPLKIMPKLFSFVRTAATVMGGALGRVGMMMLRTLPTVFTIVRTAAMFLARGVMQAGMMMLANPMVLAIVAITVAIGALAYYAYTHWDTIKGAFATGVAAISGVLSGVGATLTGAWESIKGAFNTGLDWLKGMIPTFKNIGSMMLEGLLSMLNPLRLAGHLVSMGKTAIAAFKGVLGIHSPSRVFAEMGGHVMGGLDQGMAEHSQKPVSRIVDLSKQMTRALAVGTATAAIAAPAGAVATAPSSAHAAAAAPSGNNYTIHITVGGDVPARNIADAVRDAIEKIERERRGRGFGDDGA